MPAALRPSGALAGFIKDNSLMERQTPYLLWLLLDIFLDGFHAHTNIL
jgi:hypothetical protein